MFIGLPRAPQISAVLVTCLALSFSGGVVPLAAAQDVASGVRAERSLPDVLEEITPAVVNTTRLPKPTLSSTIPTSGASSTCRRCRSKGPA